jgi:hypothetical protein
MSARRRFGAAVLGLAAHVLILGGVGQAKASPIYNNATDFSPTINPNGVWSYGVLSPGAVPNAATFSLYPGRGNTAGIDFVGVDNNGLSDPPYVSHNPTSATISVSTVTYGPGQAGFHPGSNGAYSDYRFTAPTAGSYTLSALFTGIDHGGTTTDVHVLDNGAPLFNGTINGYLATASFATTLALATGDRVDFVVGFGTNGNFFNDSTALDATLTFNPVPVATTVPEPSTFALLALGGGALAGWRRWRRGVTA